MQTVAGRTAPIFSPRRGALAARVARIFAATAAAGRVLTEAFAEARTMQRAAYRRYPFVDW